MVSKQCPTHWWGHMCHEPCRRGVQSGLECGGISHWLVMVYTFAILHAIVFAWYLLILGTNVGYIVSDVSLHEFYDLNYYFLNSELNFKKGVLSWEWSWFTILSKKVGLSIELACLTVTMFGFGSYWSKGLEGVRWERSQKWGCFYILTFLNLLSLLS